MKIQVFSDIHLEFYKTYPKIKPQAKFLFLAGDIGKISDSNYTEFIEYCSKNWQNVFVVLGNHEFYHSKKSFDKLLHEYKEFYDNFSNVTLLEKDEIYLEDYRILGLTFWSFIEDGYDIVNCTRKIKVRYFDKNENIRTSSIGRENYNKLFETSKKWLDEMYNPNIKTIIITHHPLTQENTLQQQFLNENHTKKRMNVFSTNYTFNPNEKLVCISGHTHYSHNFIDENGVHYISNQMGYNDELIKKHSNFNDIGVYNI